MKTIPFKELGFSNRFIGLKAYQTEPSCVLALGGLAKVSQLSTLLPDNPVWGFLPKPPCYVVGSVVLKRMRGLGFACTPD